MLDRTLFGFAVVFILVGVRPLAAAELFALGDATHVILRQILRFAGLSDPLLAPPKPARHSKFGANAVPATSSTHHEPAVRPGQQRHKLFAYLLDRV